MLHPFRIKKNPVLQWSGNLVPQFLSMPTIMSHSPFKGMKHTELRSKWNEMSQQRAGQNYSGLKCNSVTSNPLFDGILGVDNNLSTIGWYVTVVNCHVV